MKSPSLDRIFFLLFDGTLSPVSLPPSMGTTRSFRVCLLRRGLSPIFVDAIFQLDDGHVPNFGGHRMIQENILPQKVINNCEVQEEVWCWSQIPEGRNGTFPASPSVEAAWSRSVPAAVSS